MSESNADFIERARRGEAFMFLSEALERLAKAEAALSPVCAELKATCAERDRLRAEVAAWEATGKNLGFVKGARRK